MVHTGSYRRDVEVRGQNRRLAINPHHAFYENVAVGTLGRTIGLKPGDVLADVNFKAVDYINKKDITEEMRRHMTDR